jgi:hypothetical protein
MPAEGLPAAPANDDKGQPERSIEAARKYRAYRQSQRILKGPAALRPKPGSSG